MDGFLVLRGGRSNCCITGPDLKPAASRPAPAVLPPVVSSVNSSAAQTLVTAQSNKVIILGLFDILTLYGSFLPSEIGGQRSRAGGLIVSLVGSDGKVFGGRVACLPAASPIQLIVGSFVPDGGVPPTLHQQEPSESTESGCTQHIISVKTGENVASKILLFTENSRRAICILSASGAISDVALKPAALIQVTSRHKMTYEGLFDIVAMSRSFLPSEIDDQWMGGFSLILTGSDGRIFGGYLAGRLIAASPVQVNICCFSPPAAPLNRNLSGMRGANIPLSHSTHGELVSLLGSHPKSKRTTRVPI